MNDERKTSQRHGAQLIYSTRALPAIPLSTYRRLDQGTIKVGLDLVIPDETSFLRPFRVLPPSRPESYPGTQTFQSSIVKRKSTGLWVTLIVLYVCRINRVTPRKTHCSRPQLSRKQIVARPRPSSTTTYPTMLLYDYNYYIIQYIPVWRLSGQSLRCPPPPLDD